MQKIVINKCYGGFDLSHKGVMRYAEIKGIELFLYEGDKYCRHYSTKPIDNEKDLNDYYFSVTDIERDDPALVQVVEELETKAEDKFTELKVVKVPEDVEWVIEEYDGLEWVAERHRTWR